MLNFVTYFQPSRYEPWEQVAIFFDSIRKSHPNARCTLLIPNEAKIPDIKGLHLFRVKVDNLGNVAFNRAFAYLLYLRRANHEEAHIFLHPDMLVQDDVSHIFTSYKEDIFLTYRKDPYNLPWNDRFIAFNKNSLKRSQHFFEVCVSRLSHAPRLWKKDGLSAIFFSFLNPLIDDPKCRSTEIKGTSIHFLGKKYNYEVQKKGLKREKLKASILSYPRGVRVEMTRYWQQYIR